MIHGFAINDQKAVVSFVKNNGFQGIPILAVELLYIKGELPVHVFCEQDTMCRPFLFTDQGQAAFVYIIINQDKPVAG